MSLLATSESNGSSFPKRGYSADAIESRLAELQETLTPDIQGSLSMHAVADSEHFMPGFRVVGDHAYEVFQRFLRVRPAAGAIEDDVLDMCVEVFQGGEDGRCNITAGALVSTTMAEVGSVVGKDREEGILVGFGQVVNDEARQITHRLGTSDEFFERRFGDRRLLRFGIRHGSHDTR